ncbi:hypothetical protein CEY12_01765 [Chryseobacterium sp. T16E-39]|uniref:hypothetical protein n=1 Tax=Chryseobacterium sp. T16E-39 TaxID=2015076 RepID=UPI000B5B159D|nr:hypothetical protein [Chryseobacterium sp. T16E-39]ASK28912.1 hypothetical protein CEY12_01765 [Chryseobacterium sp. T16E-39]
MKNKPITEYTDEEIISNEKKMKAISVMLMVAIPILFLANMLLTLKNGFNASNVIPIALLPILIININKWNQLKKEKANRNL